LGYKNARFGRIEAHEAVTAYGREALLRAKEAAEDLDYEILHMYVDGLWVHKEGCKTPADFEALLAEVTERTGLPISLMGFTAGWSFCLALERKGAGAQPIFWRISGWLGQGARH